MSSGQDRENLINIDDMLADIAKENHVLVKPDDPIMILVTMFNRLSAKLIIFQAMFQEEFAEKQEEIGLNWRRDANTTANRILNASLEGGKEVITKTMFEVATQTVRMIKEETDKSLHAIRTENNKLRVRQNVITISCGCALIGGLAALAAAVLRFI